MSESATTFKVEQQLQSNTTPITSIHTAFWGPTIISTQENGKVMVWRQLEDGSGKFEFGISFDCEDTVNSAVSFSEEEILYCTKDKIFLASKESGKVVKTYEEGGNKLVLINEEIFVCVDDDTLRFYLFDSEEKVFEIKEDHSGTISCCQMLVENDGYLLAAGGKDEDHRINIWSVGDTTQMPRLVCSFREHHERIIGCVIYFDYEEEREMIASFDDDHVYHWNPNGGELIRSVSLSDHPHHITHFVPRAQDSKVIMIEESERLKVFDLKHSEFCEIKVTDGDEKKKITCIDFNEDFGITCIGLDSGGIMTYLTEFSLSEEEQEQLELEELEELEEEEEEEEEIQDLREVFDQYCEGNESGKLWSTDLIQALQEMGLSIDFSMEDELLDQYGNMEDGDHHLFDFDDFVRIYRKENEEEQEMMSEKKMLAAFGVYDENENGIISFEEFKNILKEDEGEEDDQYIEDLFDYVDKNNDGEIDYHEFVAWMYEKEAEENEEEEA